MLQTARVEPRPSRIALAGLGVLHGLALVLLLVLDAPLWVRGLLCLTCIGLAVLQLRALGWLGGKLPVSALVCNAGGCKLQWAGAPAGSWHEVKLEPDYLVSGWLTVMNIRVPGQRRRLAFLLFPDSANSQELRRLRAMLVARKVPYHSSRQAGTVSSQATLGSVSRGN